MDTIELQHPGSWRFDQLDALPDDGRRYEVVDGLLVVSPPPSFWHQAVGAARCGSCPRRGGVYEQVAVVDGAGSAPAPWGPVDIDLAGLSAG
jgi:hypothetical protein